MMTIQVTVVESSWGKTHRRGTGAAGYEILNPGIIILQVYIFRLHLYTNRQYQIYFETKG